MMYRLGGAMVLLGLLTPTAAHVHFKLNAPASWMSQDSVGGPQKNGPCAATANTSLVDSPGTPTNVVTALPSGQTVSVSVTATVAHPGWYRIALAEGASATQSLSTLADPRAQMGTNCTPAIMSNPVWSSDDRHRGRGWGGRFDEVRGGLWVRCLPLPQGLILGHDRRRDVWRPCGPARASPARTTRTEAHGYFSQEVHALGAPCIRPDCAPPRSVRLCAIGSYSSAGQGPIRDPVDEQLLAVRPETSARRHLVWV
jgi:hypothetical protein